MRPSTGRRRLDPWVGPWLRERREKQGVARETIAERIKRDVSNVIRLENGTSAIPADDLPVFLTAYEVSTAQFAVEARKHQEAA
jgi:transcriptional regulator with XRE-family HTH domain